MTAALLDTALPDAVSIMGKLDTGLLDGFLDTALPDAVSIMGKLDTGLLDGFLDTALPDAVSIMGKLDTGRRPVPVRSLTKDELRLVRAYLTWWISCFGVLMLVVEATLGDDFLDEGLGWSSTLATVAAAALTHIFRDVE
jgi:hypothetical protein